MVSNHPKVLYLCHTKEVMKRGMRKTIIIAGAVICIICAAVISYAVIERGGRDAIPTRDLTLSDYPKLFAKGAVIVIGENASQIEKESAEAIAANLENLTGNKPEIISSKKIESFKYTYNLIIIGTPKTNPLLEEVYAMTNATRVTEEFPGEGKGVLEILPNPWDESKAMLLVEGWDECSIMLALKYVKESNMSNTLTHTHICNTIAVEVIVQAIEDAELIDWEASIVPEYKGVGVFRVTVKVLNVTEGNVCLKKGELVTLIFRKPIPKLSLPKPILKGQELMVSGLYTVNKKTISSDTVNVEVEPEYECE